MSARKSTRLVVVHDVLGTLFGLEAAINELRSIFGEQVSDPRFAELIVMDWYHTTQRDFSMVNIGGDYQPIAAVFKSSLPRVLLMAGLVAPSMAGEKDAGSALHNGSKAGIGLPDHAHYSLTDSTTGDGNPFGHAVTERMMGSLARLTARPGMQDAFASSYRDPARVPSHVARVDLWGATNGGLTLARALFEGALGKDVPLFTGAQAGRDLALAASSKDKGKGIALFSCDEISTAKPDPRVYAEVRQRCTAAGRNEEDEDDVQLWFVASHTWDLFNAKRAGFKTAWITYEEFDAAKDIYGTPDVIAASVDEAAKAILTYEEKRHATD